MANMKFYMTPGSCSTGIHILLEELELIFEAYIVNLPAGEQYQPAFVVINPKSTVPVLITPDGTVLSEFCAIAWWLARSYPKAGLLPETIDGESAVLEQMNYAVGTLHMQGFTRIFTPERYAFNDADIEWVKAQGETIVRQGFALIERTLEGREYLVGQFSIADAALFYVVFWADRIDIPLPDGCRRHYQQILERPAVRQVLMEEGYASLYRNETSVAAR